MSFSIEAPSLVGMVETPSEAYELVVGELAFQLSDLELFLWRV